MIFKLTLFLKTHNPLAFLKQAILAPFSVPLTKPLSDWKPLHNVIQKVGGASALTARAGCLKLSRIAFCPPGLDTHKLSR